MKTWLVTASLAALLFGGVSMQAARAQDTAGQPGAGDASAQEEQAATRFSRTELEKLLKPVALYPDPLLAQLLPASAYPLEIVQAARWLDRNKAAVDKNDFSAVDQFNWDPSVKALVRFPQVVRKMNDDLDWTSDLGDAFVNQPEDVADVIQSLRAEAETTGALKTTPQQTVSRKQENGRQYIYIEPSDPEVIYVPQYDPVTVYEPGYGGAVAAGLIGFGTGVVVGSLINNNSWNWRSGAVYPPVWPGYPGWRPPPPGYRPGVRPPGGNINIGNDINIGNGNNLIGNTKPWRPNPDRYRPGQGSKPGLANPNRPGAPGNRPGGPGNRPGIAGKPGAPGLLPGGGDINRPGPGGGVAGRPPGGGDINRPGSGAGAAKPLPGGGNRPGAGAGSPGPGGVGKPGLQKPSTLPATKPAGRPQKPVARPAPAARPAPPPSAFGGIDTGRAAAQFGNRGAMSRQQMARPPAAMGRPGGGMSRPAGGRPPMRGGGGGRRR